MKAKIKNQTAEINEVLGINLIAQGHVRDSKGNFIEETSNYKYLKHLGTGKEVITKMS